MAGYEHLLGGIDDLITTARSLTVRAVNVFMTATYWDAGRQIVEFEQGGKARAAYGTALLERLSTDLAARHGRGFSVDNLERFRLLYLRFPMPEISATALRKSASPIRISDGRRGIVTNSATSLRNSGPAIMAWIETLAARLPLSWSHYTRLLRVKSNDAFAFYHAEALRGGWNIKQLERQLSTLFYERALLSKNKAAMLSKGAVARPEDAVSPDEEVRDPLVLEFLNLRDEYSESDLQDGLIRHLEGFLMELGGDFAFIGRQRRLRIGGEWYRVDLLFFHRRLRCLVVIDLKLGKFTHADVGQIYPMRYEQILLRLCAEKPFRRKPLCRLHKRSSQTNGTTRRRLCSIHQEPSSARTHLLRGVSRARGCDQAREIPQDRVGQTIPQKPSRWLSHGVNLYLNYAREHWMHEGENPPVGLILCAEKDEAVAKYALDNLPNKVLAREYQLLLPKERTLIAELEKTRKQLESRK